MKATNRAIVAVLDAGHHAWAWCRGYSGRGMFGRVSALAVATDADPKSIAGKRLRAMGLSYDQLGMSWIYYTHATKENKP